jgi:hypothetical protein
MAEDDVEVVGQTSDNATILLEAAEKLELDPGVVRTVEGGFSVPKDVFDKAEWPEGKKPKVRGEEDQEDAAEDAPAEGPPGNAPPEGAQQPEAKPEGKAGKAAKS